MLGASLFSGLPFADQLRVLRAACSPGQDPRALLRETGSLADPEPFARLVALLEEAGRVDDALQAALLDRVTELSDASLLYLLGGPQLVGSEGGTSPALLGRLVGGALERWQLDRITAMTLALRWLRRAAPERAEALAQQQRHVLARPPGPDAARALLFASGAELFRLSLDPAWGPVVKDAVAHAIDILARTPKSISQANAERLLARRVYADPGHFFFELLQNADDAGATRFSVRVDAHQILVRHDGEPFSLLDLVGVLSIGQTTKSNEQIGFFGVGFKSVYEVTARPRVRSGALAFEIAHVSIPRALASEPLDALEGPHGPETVLCLPRAEGDADLLFRRATAIPAESLMTLSQVRQLDSMGPRGEHVGWQSTRDEAGRFTEFTLTSRDGPTRRYRSVSRRVHFEGAREEGRARSSEVVVAARVDGDRPVILGANDASLYSFLPTAERTALPVLVHARFDVTLDRERLELDSPWNAFLLAEAGTALAELASSFSGTHPLTLLSPEGHLSPLLVPLHRACVAALKGKQVLMAAHGARVSGDHAAIVDGPLAHALAGVPLTDGRFALADLSAHAQRVARELGAISFGSAELFEFSSRSLTAGTPAPAWLGLPVWSALAEAEVSDVALQALPCLLDERGHLLAAQHAHVAPAPWVALYAGWRRLLTNEAVESLPRVLAERLALRAFDVMTAAEDLADPSSRARLLEDEEAFFSALEQSGDPLLAAIRTIPWVPARDGGWAAPEVLRRLPASLAFLAETLEKSVPLATEAFASSALGQRVVAVFDWAALVEAMEQGLLLSAADAEGLVVQLDRLESEEHLPRSLAARFAVQPLFADIHGGLRPLEGPGCALAEGERALVPSWPWLAEPDRPFVRRRALPAIDAHRLARCLAGEGPLAVPGARVPAVLAHLAQHASLLSGAEIQGLAQAACWQDLNAVLRPLRALRRGSTSPVLDAVFLSLGTRHVGAPSALAAADALGLAARVPASDHAALIEDLSRLDGISASIEDALDQALLEAAQHLSARELAPLLALPIFVDEDGVRRTLGSWSNSVSDREAPAAVRMAGEHRALLRGAGWPLMSAAREAHLAPLLRALGAAPPTFAELLSVASRLVVEPLVAWLLREPERLSPRQREELSSVPLFAARDGVLRSAEQLLAASDLAGLDPVALGLSDVVASDESALAIECLALKRADVGAILAHRVFGLLEEGAPLAACWPGTVASLAVLAGLALDASGRAAPFLLDGQGCLSKPPLVMPSAAARALLLPLGQSARFVDLEYAAACGDAVRATCLLPLPLRPTLALLRERADEVDSALLFAWLLEERDVIERDPAARDLLAHAPLFPTQSGARRPPSALVLDASVPDLGLGWGVAASVPAPLVAWLRATFEFDRHARRALVSHLLDGLADARRAQDVPRATELLAFLARALGAGTVSPEELEERARRLEVRARLEVPVDGPDTGDAGAWIKPRFAWAPRDEIAASASLFVGMFAEKMPPTLALERFDECSRLLIVACGARDDLDDATVSRCLDEMGSQSLPSRRALCRYVLRRVHSEPDGIERWRLRTRAWVTSERALFRPAERVWPDPETRALLGSDASLFLDVELARDLETVDEHAATARRLGFRAKASLTLSEVAEANAGRNATPALLAWIDEAWTEKRFEAALLRAAFDDLYVEDDEGRARPTHELAVRGAAALLGSRRGDWSAGDSLVGAARALRIPSAPDAPFLLSYLAEVGALDAQTESDALVRGAQAALERLAKLDPDAVLGAGMAVPVLHLERMRVAQVGDPALLLISPSSLAAAYEGAWPSEVMQVLSADLEPAVLPMLLRAGVDDLHARLVLRQVHVENERADLQQEAEQLRQRLVRLLPSNVRMARVTSALSITGALAIAGSELELSEPVVVDGAIDGETLWVTPSALKDPTLLAPLLGAASARRAEVTRMLGHLDQAADVPKPAASPRPKPTPVSAPQPPGLLARMRRFFGGEEEPTRALPQDDRALQVPPPIAKSPPRSTRKRGGDFSERDARSFSPLDSVRGQLEGGEGWVAARREVPSVGFAFVPSRLEAPWVYAPRRVVTDFQSARQLWASARIAAPPVRGEAGMLAMRGRLPAGEAVLPVPMFGSVASIVARSRETKRVMQVPLSSASDGAALIRLPEPADLEVRVRLGHAPDFARATASDSFGALTPSVADAELPNEALDFVADLDLAEPPARRALAIRDFVRERYRYDPSYLEDPSVGRWLARVTAGSSNVHIAALHASRSPRHLGAGVCYELNAMACEMMRRAQIPAGLAVGWVMNGGHLSEPDHLWAVAFLVDEQGSPAWLPIDASSTREGRPLQVPRRPPPPIRPPSETGLRAPPAPRVRDATLGDPGERHPGERPRTPKKAPPPRAELHRVLRHLGKLAGRPLTDAERAEVEAGLEDQALARELLDRLAQRR